ncbi:hypothetical protein RM553_11835 [Zunongwangia sp. F363]|uniref:Uncharacterized protein n=1 Tax=Autumnicola tepida TaxID=3075595 RepID=A0ABU3CB13_9FLAO|nr:hypothetical protein [Zunongwangia sp. F363]MDT0643524.1 hypothetical protein [Zunongwangia sp. F363]
MTKITKPQHFLKQNATYLMGGFWFFFGTLCYFLKTEMPYEAYMIIGLGGLAIGYFTRNSREEYIKWNGYQIKSKDLINGEVVYKWTEVDRLIFSEGHLTIKSGEANGIMLELKEYRREDVEKLRADLSNFTLIQPGTS